MKHTTNFPKRSLALCGAAALLLPLSAAAGGGGEKSGYGAKDASETAEHAAQSVQSAAGQAAETVGDAASDLRMHTALEAKLAASDQLSAFMVDTDVQDGLARLQGEVKTEAERELASQLALSVDGITGVRNDLRVTGGEPTAGEKLAQAADDAALTAKVKSRLLLSEHTSGLSIDVDTRDEVVTLTGDVGSGTEAELAGLIAANTAGVEDVRNDLRISND